MEKKRRRPYWRRTKWHSLSGLVVPIAMVLSLPFLAGEFGSSQVWGFPLGYILIAHGAVVIGVVAVLRFISRQDSVDRWHGAHDDV